MGTVYTAVSKAESDLLADRDLGAALQHAVHLRLETQPLAIKPTAITQRSGRLPADADGCQPTAQETAQHFFAIGSSAGDDAVSVKTTGKLQVCAVVGQTLERDGRFAASCVL